MTRKGVINNGDIIPFSLPFTPRKAGQTEVLAGIFPDRHVLISILTKISEKNIRGQERLLPGCKVCYTPCRNPMPYLLEVLYRNKTRLLSWGGPFKQDLHVIYMSFQRSNYKRVIIAGHQIWRRPWTATKYPPVGYKEKYFKAKSEKRIGD